MPTKANRAIGSLDYSDPERRKLARNSRTWRCETCGPIRDLLKHPESTTHQACSSSCQSSSSHQCEEAGTSRINLKAGNLPSQSETSGQNGKSDRSDSDGEIRDNSTDSQSSASSNGSDVDSEQSTATTSIMQQQREHNLRDRRAEFGVKKARSLKSDSNNNEQQHTTSQDDDIPDELVQSQSSEQTTPVEARRSYPPLVFVSIFILLFLLIIRRIFITFIL